MIRNARIRRQVLTSIYNCPATPDELCKRFCATLQVPAKMAIARLRRDRLLIMTNSGHLYCTEKGLRYLLKNDTGKD